MIVGLKKLFRSDIQSSAIHYDCCNHWFQSQNSDTTVSQRSCVSSSSLVFDTLISVKVIIKEPREGNSKTPISASIQSICIVLMNSSFVRR